jgi:hypothetical protein
MREISARLLAFFDCESECTCEVRNETCEGWFLFREVGKSRRGSPPLIAVKGENRKTGAKKYKAVLLGGR